MQLISLDNKPKEEPGEVLRKRDPSECSVKAEKWLLAQLVAVEVHASIAGTQRSRLATTLSDENELSHN